MSAADIMGESLNNDGNPSPSPSPSPKRKSKGKSESKSNNQGKAGKAWDGCHRKKTRCHPSHTQLQFSPVMAAAAAAADPASASPDLITGSGNSPSRIVTLHVNAANVPPHLKAMPSQGTPNDPAPVLSSAPAPTVAASRAPSAAPTPSAMPAEAAEHGAATRVYMNTKVTYHLLAGMKELAKHKPENPLRVLGEFLLARSAQYETGSAATTSAGTGASAAAGDDNAMGDE